MPCNYSKTYPRLEVINLKFVLFKLSFERTRDWSKKLFVTFLYFLAKEIRWENYLGHCASPAVYTALLSASASTAPAWKTDWWIECLAPLSPSPTHTASHHLLTSLHDSDGGTQAVSVQYSLYKVLNTKEHEPPIHIYILCLTCPTGESTTHEKV